MKVLWQHAKPEDAAEPKPHTVEPRYGADGKWACYVCRGPVNDGGRSVNMTAVRGFDVFDVTE